MGESFREYFAEFYLKYQSSIVIWVVWVVVTISALVVNRLFMSGNSKFMFKFATKYKWNNEYTYRGCVVLNYFLISLTMAGSICLYNSIMHSLGIIDLKSSQFDTNREYIIPLITITIMQLILLLALILDSNNYNRKRINLMKKLERLSKIMDMYGLKTLENQEIQSILLSLEYDYFIDRNLFEDIKNRASSKMVV